MRMKMVVVKLKMVVRSRFMALKGNPIRAEDSGHVCEMFGQNQDSDWLTGMQELTTDRFQACSAHHPKGAVLQKVHPAVELVEIEHDLALSIKVISCSTRQGLKESPHAVLGQHDRRLPCTQHAPSVDLRPACHTIDSAVGQGRSTTAGAGGQGGQRPLSIAHGSPVLRQPGVRG